MGGKNGSKTDCVPRTAVVACSVVPDLVRRWTNELTIKTLEKEGTNP
jgi:hypothetical protein